MSLYRPDSWGAASDRTVRSLLHLQNTASTARSLNLVEVWNKFGDTAEYATRPLFGNATLNRSIIVKHRLRPNERDAFTEPRTGATKVLLPIDLHNLRAGAHAFFIGQKGYRGILDELYQRGSKVQHQDEALLKILDSVPSLDPFLLRERLKKARHKPARCYFDINAPDTVRMFEFTRREISAMIGVIGVIGDDDDEYFVDKSSRLASKILSNSSETELEPLRIGLGMDHLTFDEGVFCWKGFIYYKWILSELLPQVRGVTQEIGSVVAKGRPGDDDRIFIAASRDRLSRTITAACETVRNTLGVYDDAFHDLTRNGRPQAFRSFLLQAPSLFYELGERLGAVQHIVSFWQYRVPLGSNVKLPAEELIDVLADFELSLNFDVQASVVGTQYREAENLRYRR
jgi:hypothetical protein